MKLSIAILVLLFACSCKHKPDQSALLSETTMKEVMWDLMRADVFVSDFVMKDSSLNKKNESIRLYEQVFHIHKISKEQFKSSLDYYTSRPDLFQPIIDSLAKRGNGNPHFTPWTKPVIGKPGMHNKDSLRKTIHGKLDFIVAPFW